MAVKQLRLIGAEGGKWVTQMILHHRLAGWMDIGYVLALMVTATACSSLEQAIGVLKYVCCFGGSWYSYHGYAFFQCYRRLGEGHGTSRGDLMKLRRLWIRRFVYPVMLSVGAGAIIAAGQAYGWFAR